MINANIEMVDPCISSAMKNVFSSCSDFTDHSNLGTPFVSVGQLYHIHKGCPRNSAYQLSPTFLGYVRCIQLRITCSHSKRLWIHVYRSTNCFDLVREARVVIFKFGLTHLSASVWLYRSNLRIFDDHLFTKLHLHARLAMSYTYHHATHI